MADAGPSGRFTAAQLPGTMIVLALVIVGLLSLLALGGWRIEAQVTGWSDLGSYHLPKYQYVAERFREGALPLWNPWEFCGIPFLASLQPGVFYPPVPFFYSLWSGETAHIAFFFFHVAVAALGTLLLMRSFGCGPWPSILGSLWVTQPLWLVRVYDHPNFIASVCWIPWLILLSRRCLLAPSLRVAVGLAVTAALPFLAGYPPALFATVYVLLLGAPFWLFEARGPAGGACVPWQRALAIVVAGSVCVLLAAAQLLPTAELVLVTSRKGDAAAIQDLLSGMDEPASRTRFLIGIPQLTFGAAALEFWSTFGPALIGFVLLALVVGRRGAPVWYLLAAVVMTGLLPYPAYTRLPLYDHVRWALEWHFIAPMMVFMLAGCGLDALLARGWVHSGGAAACALVVAALSLGWNWRLIDPSWLTPLSAAAVPIPDEAARGCELEDQRFRAYWPAGQSRASLFTARVRSIGGYESSLMPARTARLVNMLRIGNGLQPSGLEQSMARNGTILARMGLRCLIKRDGPLRPFRAHVIPQAQPRARLVRDAHFAGSAEESLQLLRANPGPLVLEAAPEALPAGACDGSPGTATIVRDTPEEVRITTNAGCASYLVLADTNLPGWRAALDGQDVPILTADFAFRAVRVPAGEHEVSFRYAPWTVPAGVAASLFGIVMAVGLVLLPRRHDPLRPPHSSRT
jgi:hypothetical protein